MPRFWIKAALAVGLVALADWLVFETIPGAGLGIFALSWTAALALAMPATWRNRTGLAALTAAAFFAALQIERATPLGMLLFALSIGVAALSPRAGLRDDVWRWAQRLIVAGFLSIPGPFRDLGALNKARSRGGPLKLGAVLLAAVVPVVGGIVFFSLFTLANPVIEEALAGLSLPEFDIGRLMFWAVVAFAVRTSLRPWASQRLLALPAKMRPPAVGPAVVTAASVTASLFVFNAVFALQNGLDIAFLWSGAPLPQGMTFAEYAHRGAYPLIATALLAGLFVLVFLRPGTPTAASPLVRGLVIAWVAQNLFLVASTALRTIDYIDAYSLTRLRIAALIWMVLVALGLVLICWRLMKSKSAGWLINANALAVGLALTACAVMDLGAVAANWNVAHAREVGGRGAALDVGYVGGLNGAGVVALAKLERRSLDPVLGERVVRTRCRLVAQMARQQSDWRSWRWRDARRLDRVAALTAPGACAALPPEVQPAPAAPLTPPANARS